MMNEDQKHTEFLRQCILYEESEDRHELHKEMTRVQRDARCVRRAVCLMAGLIALVVASFIYGMIFLDNAPQFVMNLIYALGLGSLISLVVFLGLGMVYRKKLHQRREECRQRVARLLKSRLGK